MTGAKVIDGRENRAAEGSSTAHARVANLAALEESGLRFVFSYGANANPATATEVRRVKQAVIDPNPLAHLQIGSHPTTENYAGLAASEQLARELGVPLNVHLRESKEDPATGQMEALRRAGAIRPGLLVNHAIYLTDAELDELAAADVRVAGDVDRAVTEAQAAAERLRELLPN